MKRIILIISIFCFISSFSQLSLKKLDGTPINDNDIIVFNANTDPAAYLGFNILNSSSSSINVKVQCESIVNADGNDVQLCLGSVCVSGITEGGKYPNTPAVIPANGQNGNFDHFLNLSSGTIVGNNVDYVFRFYMLTATNQVIGNAVTFTYRYAPLLATNNFSTLSELGVKLKSNLVYNQIEIENTTYINSKIFDLNGRLLHSQELTAGNQTIDVSNLNSGIYLLNIINKENQQSTIKFIKY